MRDESVKAHPRRLPRSMTGEGLQETAPRRGGNIDWHCLQTTKPRIPQKKREKEVLRERKLDRLGGGNELLA